MWSKHVINIVFRKSRFTPYHSYLYGKRGCVDNRSTKDMYIEKKYVFKNLIYFLFWNAKKTENSTRDGVAAKEQ